MSAIIERDFDFQAAVYFQSNFLVNLYDFTLTMEVNTDSIHEQNIALERVKYMVYEVFENAVFIQDTEDEMIKLYKAANLKVCKIPDEPFDQILALLIMLKIDSVLENRLKVTDITLTSKLSDLVKFKETIITAQNTFTDNDWYKDPGPTLSTEVPSKRGREKVVKIKNNDWKETGLLWKEKRESPKEIVFNFDSLDK